MTDLCVAIFVEDAAQVKRDVARAAEAGADLVELRVDRITDEEQAQEIVAGMNALPAEVNKIVWAARNIRDNLEVFELLKTRQRPTIGLCMGEAGLISRVLTKKFGGF